MQAFAPVCADLVPPASPRSLRPLPGRHELLTVRETAEILRTSTATIYSLIKAGELAHVRVSNAIRIARREVGAYLARGTK